MDFSKIFDKAPVGVIISSNHNKEIIYANGFLLRQLKYTAEGVAGKKLDEILFRSSTSGSYMKTVDQEERIVEINESEISTHSGKVNTIFYITFPEEKSDAVYLDAMMLNIPDLIYFKDKHSRFLRVNEAYLKKFNLKSQEELRGKTDFDLFAGSHAKEAFEDEKDIMRSGKPIFDKEEKEIDLKDGKVTWVSSSKMPFYDSEMNLIGTFGISKDITHQKQTELQVKDHMLVLNGLTANMPIVIYKYFGIDKRFECIGKKDTTAALMKSKMARLMFEENLGYILEIASANKEKQGFFTFASYFKNDETIRYFDNYIFESVSGSIEYLGISIDVTERRLNDQNLKKHAKNLEKTNKELSQFAYIISHDLKAPLRAITNLSEWIGEDLEDYENPDVKENLELLRTRVLRLENLINGILNYSRATRDTVLEDNVDVKNVIDEVVESLNIPECFKLSISPKLPKVSFNRSNLERIFTNLISNAFRHHDKSSGNITIGYTEKADAHEFFVEDDGPGIADEYHEKIFVIFQTLKARDTFESTGIGLTIVKKIIEDNGGSIWIESQLDKGTKFIFQIPKKIV